MIVIVKVDIFTVKICSIVARLAVTTSVGWCSRPRTDEWGVCRDFRILVI